MVTLLSANVPNKTGNCFANFLLTACLVESQHRVQSCSTRIAPFSSFDFSRRAKNSPVKKLSSRPGLSSCVQSRSGTTGFSGPPSHIARQHLTLPLKPSTLDGEQRDAIWRNRNADLTVLIKLRKLRLGQSAREFPFLDLPYSGIRWTTHFLIYAIKVAVIAIDTVMRTPLCLCSPCNCRVNILGFPWVANSPSACRRGSHTEVR